MPYFIKVKIFKSHKNISPSYHLSRIYAFATDVNGVWTSGLHKLTLPKELLRSYLYKIKRNKEQYLPSK